MRTFNKCFPGLRTETEDAESVATLAEWPARLVVELLPTTGLRSLFSDWISRGVSVLPILRIFRREEKDKNIPS
jgi:hypothetical protein